MLKRKTCKSVKEGIQREINDEDQGRRKAKQANRVNRERQLQGGLTALHVAAMKGNRILQKAYAYCRWH